MGNWNCICNGPTFTTEDSVPEKICNIEEMSKFYDEKYLEMQEKLFDFLSRSSPQYSFISIVDLPDLGHNESISSWKKI
jgi:hypothetical protein